MFTTVGEYNEAETHACLDRILASPIFAHAERQKRLLRYLVGATLGGKAHLLKGYTIGIEVFDRAATFDPALNAIVRVQAGHLRAKLREYYDGEGHNDSLRLALPKGNYAIRIVPREQALYDAAGQKVPPSSCLPTRFERRISSKGDDVKRRADFTRAIPIDNKPSLAVLPFINMSSDPEQEYFADGITEDLITDLSKLSSLFVIARHSAFVYKGVAKRVQEIGRELGVRYLLEGSVRRAADRVRITAQLVDSEFGDHLWAERYDRELSEIFALQDEVTRSIVDALELRLTRDDNRRLAQLGTDSVEAYDLCRRGNAAYMLWTLDSLDWAQAFYERSMVIDPSYAEPHAWLARVHTYRWLLGVRPRAQSLDAALILARRAVALHEELSLAQGMLSWVCNWSGLHEEAIVAARRAVSFDPGGAESYYWLGVSLSCSGSTAEADRELARAMRLNPVYPVYYAWARAQNYMFMHRFSEAIEITRQLVRTAPTFIGAYSVLTVSLALNCQMDDARRVGMEMNRLFPEYRKHSDAMLIGFKRELGDLYPQGFKLAGI